MPDASAPKPTAGQVHEELARVLGSPAFANAARAQRFLRYVVEQVLAGQGDGIKEVVLGTEVFDRGSDFDPRIDTIVRVEAGKLRKRLDDYYTGEGASNPLRIDIPKGSYVPRFEPRARTARAAPLSVKWLASAAALAAIIGAVAWAATRDRPAVPATASIAVLPFQNFSPDPANEYLADGLSEDLTDALSRSGLRVVARTSAYMYKGRQADIREIGERLNAQYLIEGSVRRDGERLKVTAQLVRTDDGYHVWSRSFERTMRDALAVQGEIARTVVDSVAAIARPGGRAPQPYRPRAEAFDLYLQATRAMNSDIREAERLLHASIAADARYARPHVALANAYIVQDIFGVRSTTELAALARVELDRALAMDPESAEAHAAMGGLLARHYFQWDAAEQQMRRALELDPHSSFAHNQLAQNILAPQERWEEAEAETYRALELDPLSTAIPTGRAFLAHLRRDFKTAIQEFREAVARNPQPLEYSGLFGSLAADGQLEEASKLEPRLMPGMGPMLLAVRASALARAGRTAEARAVVRQIETYAAKQFVSASVRGIGAGTIGRLDEAFRLMDQARAEHSSNLIFLRLLTEYDPLRADPRFAALLADVGLSDQDLEKRRVNRK